MSERVHELKCWPQYFDVILSGEKTFEVRKDGWILTGGQFGIEPGYVVFSLEQM